MNGKFVEVRIDATINMGNYSSEKIGVTYVMGENEDIFKTIAMCKDVVYGKAVVTNVDVVTEQKTAPATATEKKAPATVTKKKDVAPTTEKKVLAETAAAPVAEENKAEEVATEQKTAPEPKRNIAKVKNTVYNRGSEDHKRLLSAFLDKAFPNWKSKEYIKKASEISASLSEKEDFLDGEGVILESFKQKFLAGLK